MCITLAPPQKKKPKKQKKKKKRKKKEKKKKHMTAPNFEADLWPEIGDFFFGLTV